MTPTEPNEPTEQTDEGEQHDDETTTEHDVGDESDGE